MASAKRQKRGTGKMQVRWHYYGAVGLLQPLSEEFLYRSPSALYGHCCRFSPRSDEGKS